MQRLNDTDSELSEVAFSIDFNEFTFPFPLQFRWTILRHAPFFNSVLGVWKCDQKGVLRILMHYIKKSQIALFSIVKRTSPCLTQTTVSKRVLHTSINIKKRFSLEERKMVLVHHLQRSVSTSLRGSPKFSQAFVTNLKYGILFPTQLSLPEPNPFRKI